MRVGIDSINLNMSDREVADGSLQESINLQWRDGANKPIPFRLESEIDAPGFSNIIAHKIGDESQINILGFWTAGNNCLYLIGRLIDGVYEDLKGFNHYHNSCSHISFDIVYSEGLSFTILNGLIYFMSTDNEFYYQVQYDETDESYSVKDMYAWKDIEFTKPSSIFRIYSDGTYGTTNSTVSICGVIFIRYSFVLATGEEVKHSTIYPHLIYAINSGVGDVNEGDFLEGIHCCVCRQMHYKDEFQEIFEDNIVSTNIYASAPIYKTTFESDGESTATSLYWDNFTKTEVVTAIKENYDSVFYLIGTSNVADLYHTTDYFAPERIQLLLYVETNNNIFNNAFTYKVDMSTIASGEVMPTDNYTHHKIYGNQSSYNNRGVVSKPKTVMVSGIVSNNGVSTSGTCRNAFVADTEDGKITSQVGIITNGDSSFVKPNLIGYSGGYVLSRGLIGYPDTRCKYIAVSGVEDSNSTTTQSDGSLSLSSISVPTSKIKATACSNNNLAVSLDFDSLNIGYLLSIADGFYTLRYDLDLLYKVGDAYTSGTNNSYTSENRMQLTEAGEYSVFPVANSYRVGEGKIMFIGNNKVNPESADLLSPLIVGTTDGIYTVNFDQTGVNLINSITKTANLPAMSSNTLDVDGKLVYVSDKGLMAVNSGDVINLTKDHFPSHGNGNYPSPLSVYTNYDLLQTRPDETSFIDTSSYYIDDIVSYMKGAVFAYDGRRNNIWCSNSSYGFSLIYNIELGKWSVSMISFDSTVEFYSTIVNDGTEYYTRYLINSVSSQITNNLLILSGEDEDTDVAYHYLTRPIKLGMPDVYKKFDRLISRCQLKKGTNGLFTFGLWGKQDVNKDSKSIPLIAIRDDSSYKSDIRQDIPVGSMKGKYKSITVMQAGVASPDSSIDGIDISAIKVDDGKMR